MYDVTIGTNNQAEGYNYAVGKPIYPSVKGTVKEK